MNIEQARTLLKVLDDAIATAEAKGETEVDLRAGLDAEFNDAAAELQAAIAKRS